MIVLVPVSRFRVAYEVARGRPYSRLERRVLEAIAGGGATLRTLRAAFHLHERLLVESVVTLVNAGWVAVAGGVEATFVLTAEGRAAIEAHQDPVSVVVSKAKPQTVVLERVTGQIARHFEARSYRRDDLSDVLQSAAFVTSRIFRNALDEAQVQKLLPRGPGEWVRWVGPITLASKNVHFLPVDVDIETSQVRGLPPSWHEALLSHVIAAARGRRARDEEETAQPAFAGGAEMKGAQPPFPGTGRRRARFVSVADVAVQRTSEEMHVIVGPDDVIVGTEAHGRALAMAVERVARNLLVASPSIDPDRLSAFLASSAEAVRRRVRLDILPGTTTYASDQAAVLDAINRVGYQAAGSDGRRLLRTGTQVTCSGASLLLYDDDSGRLVTIVGNFDWLGPTVASTPLSVRLSDAGVAGTLARAAASLWSSAQPSGDAGAADRWRYLASAMEERAAMEEIDVARSVTGETTRVAVIIDDEHMAPGPNQEQAVRVGRFRSDADDGHNSIRGLSLQLIGPGAELVMRFRRRDKPFE